MADGASNPGLYGFFNPGLVLKHLECIVFKSAAAYSLDFFGARCFIEDGFGPVLSL